MNIGTRGGRMKASTGYAFLRIQHDPAAIVRSLELHGHPFAPTFTDLFKNNPIQRIFRFLDETGDLLDNVKLMLSLDPRPFVTTMLRVLAGRI